MNNIYLGNITMTHGLKGDLKLYSNLSIRDKVLKVGQIVYINNIKHTISSISKSKGYYLVRFDNLNNINLVEDFRNSEVYINREDLNNINYVIEDTIGYEVYDNDKLLGKVKEICYTNNSVLIKVMGVKEFYIPYNNHFIKDVLVNDKKILTNNGGELIL